ncbi:unnamed protein product [Urochloa humidicola]
MCTVRALDRLVLSKELPAYKVSYDRISNLSLILCPTSEVADSFRGHFVAIQDKVVFEQVTNAHYLPIAQDVDQHVPASRFF